MAQVVQDRPDEVVAAHADFFRAGAQVATTASYQASFDGLARLGLDRTAATTMLASTIELADRARRRVAEETGDDEPRWVAASIGPYGAALADGSEYRGDYGLSVADLVDWHRPRFEVLAASGADVLALETIPCLAEVEALLGLVDGSGHPCWLSLTVDGDRTRAGEPAADAFAMAADVDEVVAVGVNCSRSRLRSRRTDRAPTPFRCATATRCRGTRWTACWRHSSPAAARTAGKSLPRRRDRSDPVVGQPSRPVIVASRSRKRP